MVEQHTPGTGRARARRRVPLVLSLLVVMLAVALAPLFITAYALIETNRETIESSTREYQLQVAGSLASRFDAALAAARRNVAAAAESVRPLVPSEPGAPLPLERMREALAPHLAGDMLLIRYTAASGAVAQAASREVPDAEALRQGLFEAFSLAVEGEASADLGVRLGEMEGAAGPRPGAIVSAPVIARGRPAGVVAAVVDLAETWRLGVNDVGSDYAILAIDAGGELLAHANLSEALADGTYRKLEIVRRFLDSQGTIKEAIPLTVPGGLFDKEMLAASAPTSLGWGLFVLVDRSLAYHAADEMRRQVYRWALFAIGLCLIAAVVASGLVTRPLGALVEGTRRLARGEFGTPVQVRSRSELGELADTFNRMGEEIQNHIHRLGVALEDNQQLLLGTIRSLAAAIDEKDPYTRGHSERVNRYAVAIAKHMGLTKSEVRDVMISALLHDVGKIGIEDAILRKPSALSDDEFKIMKRHPEKGSHIMAAIPQMRNIIGGIRNHHERWSGGGYPDNLKGEEIPLIARIVQVADTFDAMTTTRPYQRAMKFEAGVARIRELSGIVFDPRVVDAFQEAWVAGDLKVEARPGPRAAEPNPAEVGT